MLQYQSKAKSKAKQAYTLDAKPHDSHLPVLQVFKFNLCSTSTTPAHPIYGNQSIEVHSLGCWQSHKNLGLVYWSAVHGGGG